MLAIPIPFIVSFLLGLLAALLLVRLGEKAKTTSLFLLLCAVTMGLVGLRWTFHLALLGQLQPFFASLIPVAAWYIFTRADGEPTRFPWRHACGPALVLISLLTASRWGLPLDGILTGIYLCYGIALVRCSARGPLLLHIAFHHWEGVRRAEHVAGWMLLFSAAIDGAISLDFALNQGRLSLYIVTLGHLILLPVLAVAVVMVGVSLPEVEEPPLSTGEGGDRESALTPKRAGEIVMKLDALMKEQACYLDPELTLSRLSRKLGIPAKQISMAVNLVHRQSIPRVINDYRIAHAKQALLTTDESITRIFMQAGFQTKSNFNREFQRITGMTPSLFRKQGDMSAPS
ncbi:AraC family transcriptional regulator [Aeromonas diversa CDC 2478-85]|uniref:AraC family transcriptional regulator n=1 Tax=Aeromonas diversa CDC 2478-85 TaxID=1268237 RepID=N9TXK2_9GAMM|nr:AraC family transcriptional regulator [Aeromonas diversa]ENY70775.1 AraC family transcriptional regulator [Aeromonas diversa CDC 2478-85]